MHIHHITIYKTSRLFDTESDYHNANRIKRCGSNLDQYPNKIAKINPHHQIHYLCVKLPFPLKPRDWLNRIIFKRLDNGDYIYCSRSVDESGDDIPKFDKSSLRPSPTSAEFAGFYKLERLPFDCCKVTYVAKVDIKGSVPKVVVETGLGTIVDTPRRAYEFFKRDKEVSVMRG